MGKNLAELTGVKIEVSIDCTKLLDEDVDIIGEFGKLGDEVVFYTHVTVTKDVTSAYTYVMLSEEVKALKAAMDETYKRLLKSCGIEED